ncbi:MAG: RNA ligase (ATP) [Promethearchaeota archaeon]
MVRKLASIRRINSIDPIPGAERIEVATVDGWKVVVRKDDGFKPGDKAVYFEIDSFLPYREPFMFLKSSSYNIHADGSRGFRLRTIKLRGQLSQGLLLPLSLFKDEIDGIEDMPPGTDLTKALGVKLWEAPVSASADSAIKREFPTFLRKADQERIQNLPEYFTLYKGMNFEATEKVDGTSAIYYYRDGDFGVCSRNYDLGDDARNIHWIVAHKTGIKKRLQDFGGNIAIYGEIAGSGIQGNPLGLSGYVLFVFDIWSIDKQRYLVADERLSIFSELSREDDAGGRFRHVPIISSSIDVFNEYPDVSSLLAFADGKSLVNKDRIREGIVFKSLELMDGAVVSFKAVSNRYLLKSERKKKKR